MKTTVAFAAALSVAYFVTPVASADARTLCQVTASTLNLRNGPGVQFGIVRQLQEGAIRRQYRTKGNWADLHTRASSGKNGHRGWASRKYLDCWTDDAGV